MLTSICSPDHRFTLTAIGFGLVVLLLNQSICVDGSRLTNEQQNELDRSRWAPLQKILLEKLFDRNEQSRAVDENLQINDEMNMQRRFCCMSPLSGRKRSIRDLTRKQIRFQ